MIKNLLIFCCAVLASAGALHAEEPDDTALDDTLIVYGVRLDQPATEVGSSVSVLTADEIEALGSSFVLDAIATMPGVTINQNGSFGGVATVRIRGASSAQTLVIIDGVIANDPSSPGGGFDFARMDPANIDRVEVLKGPQSTLWGTDAIGGVVNIVTKQPEEGLNGNVFAQTGSYNSFRGGVEFEGAGDRRSGAAWSLKVPAIALIFASPRPDSQLTVSRKRMKSTAIRRRTVTTQTP